MKTGSSGIVLQQFRTLFDGGSAVGLSDRQLLERFTVGGGPLAEAAFAAIVARHGPMVLRVCRKVLNGPQDADDAFQATFLVLARRAGSVRRRDSLACWLHGVALRVAGCASRAEARRRRHETHAAGRKPSTHTPIRPDDDLAPVLHEELARLPGPYREALVLCYLQGRTCEEAALELGWPVGTVKSRLARGRERLRGRLARRGLAPPDTAFEAGPPRTAVPVVLAASTARTAVAIVYGSTLADGVVPPAVVGLMEGVLGMMTLQKWLGGVAAALTLGLAAVAASSAARPPALPTDDAPPAPAPARAAQDDPHPREFDKRPLPEYVVEPPDMIRIELSKNFPGGPLGGERLVRPDGTVHLDAYGNVFVAGLTCEEIKEKVVVQLRKFFNEQDLGLVAPDPDHPDARKAVAPRDSAILSVDVVAYNSKFYYVLGDVATPGRFPVTGNETVLDAITLADGASTTSARSAIDLVRPAPPGAAARPNLTVDLDAIIRRGDSSTNYQLMPGDRLIVNRAPEASTPSPAEPKPEPTKRPDDGRIEALERRVAELEKLLGRTPPRDPASQPGQRD